MSEKDYSPTATADCGITTDTHGLPPILHFGFFLSSASTSAGLGGLPGDVTMILIPMECEPAFLDRFMH